MDFELLSKRLAERGQLIEGVLRSDAFVPDAATEPHLYVGEFTIDYDQSFGGLQQVDIELVLLVARSTDRHAQAALKKFMADTGPSSVKATIEGDRGMPQTLGGACDDLHVRAMRGHRLYQVGDGDGRYYGAQWVTRVIGTISDEG